MCAQNRCWRHRADGALETSLDRWRFSRVRNHRNDCSRFQNLANRHGNGLLRDGCDIREPAFAYLLAAAGLIEIHDDVGIIRVEIRRRIVKSEMAVFADACKRHVNGGCFDGVACTTDDFSWLVCAIHQVMLAYSGSADQALLQVFAKTGRMRHRKSDVFIQMEQLDALPIDLRHRSQRIQKLELRSSSCGDDARQSSLVSGSADSCCGLSCCCSA